MYYKITSAKEIDDSFIDVRLKQLYKLTCVKKMAIEMDYGETDIDISQINACEKDSFITGLNGEMKKM